MPGPLAASSQEDGVTDEAGQNQLERLHSIDSENPEFRLQDAHNTQDIRLIERWGQLCKAAAPSTSSDFPIYFNNDPASLKCSANIHDRLTLGIGEDICDKMFGAITEATEEVILVTCFWACSPSLDLLNAALRKLSHRRLGKPKVRVRICFSSLSWFQKLFHTTAQKGLVYPPSQWKRRLGLPDPSELEGLDLEVRSIFFRPFSVWHQKFVILDRRYVYLPSCNVSWEKWFEGCVVMSGNSIIEQFVKFWKAAWASDADQSSKTDTPEADIKTWRPHPAQMHHTMSSLPMKGVFGHVPAIFLPSPHHATWKYYFWPWNVLLPPPPTPLNNFLLAAFAQASSSIYIQSPNVTSQPVLTALIDALKRGVKVHILTSENLMVLEQLVTAGTTTKRCMNALKVKHEDLIESYTAEGLANASLLESGEFAQPGRLVIDYFAKRFKQLVIEKPNDREPRQSHLKLTIVDERWTVLGSGNMDRASWYTSQELGVAFQSGDYAKHVIKQLGKWLPGRKINFYDSQPGAE